MNSIAPPSPPYIAARHHGGSQTPKAVVMHGTVGPDRPGSARDIANWWHGPTSPVTSAHYVVDPTEIVQCVYDHTVAYHCGYNTDSIGVELCDEETGPASRWKDKNSKAILASAARLVATLCLAYNIEIRRPSVAELKEKGPHGIYGHDDSRLAFGHTTHTDPRDFDWPSFIRMVQQEADKMTTRPKSKLRVVSWNVYEGHKWQDARKQLQEIIAAQKPDVIVTEESIALAGHLNGLGYQVVQYASHVKHKGNKPETANIAILVRNDLRIKGRYAMTMRLTWKGPKHGLPHDPRVHRWVLIQKDGRIWKLGGAHIPFGKAAQAETKSRLRKWFRNTLKGRPTVLVGDMNTPKATFDAQVSKPVGATTGGVGVDLSACRNCRQVAQARLPKHGSDHHAMRYDFEAE